MPRRDLKSSVLAGSRPPRALPKTSLGRSAHTNAPHDGYTPLDTPVAEPWSDSPTVDSDSNPTAIRQQSDSFPTVIRQSDRSDSPTVRQVRQCPTVIPTVQLMVPRSSTVFHCLPSVRQSDSSDSRPTSDSSDSPTVPTACVTMMLACCTDAVAIWWRCRCLDVNVAGNGNGDGNGDGDVDL